MGVIIDSCKRTVSCCDSDDESGYKRVYSKYIESESENEDNDDEEEADESKKQEEEKTPKDINDMKIKTNNLFWQRHQDPWEVYEELEELGVGNYGVVKKVRLIKNPEIIRAMKIIPEENVVQGEGASLIDEIEILKNLEHPNIMKVYESFVFNNNYYIVSEFCDQGHLLSKMEKLERMDQIVVKFLMDQILNAIAYLHSKNILHGDIKLENVLLYKVSKRGGRRFTSINEDFNEDQALTDDINRNFGNKKTSAKSKNYIQDMMNYEIKLIDFGCSKYFVKKNKKKKLSGIIGTSIYCSPEVVDNLYDEKCDEWSCGVLMYILLGGIPPFYGDTEEEIFQKIKNCDYDFSPPPFKKVSKNCKDLIRRLLEPKKQYRIKASEALSHPFFTESFDPNSAMTENKDLNILKQFIKPIKYASKFHEVVVAYLCVNFIPEEEEKALKTVFRYLDKDNKGIITKDAIKECLSEINVDISDEELQNIFNSIDENGSGLIEYQEFIRNACDIKKLMNESNLHNVFHAICLDREIMTGEDIKKFVFHDSTIHEQTLNEFLDQVGIKLEDKVTFDEFSNMIKNNCKLGGKGERKKDESKYIHKKHVSRYAFKGPVIDEEKADEEDGGITPRKKYKEDEEEEDETKENGEVKSNGIKEDENITEEKLNTVADTIVDNSQRKENLEEILTK
jgi:calcium-dependent protein kinase